MAPTSERLNERPHAKFVARTAALRSSNVTEEDGFEIVQIRVRSRQRATLSGKQLRNRQHSPTIRDMTFPIARCDGPQHAATVDQEQEVTS